MKLLIVDDSMMVRNSIERVFADSRYFTDIKTAPDGVLALAQFQTFLPDVVTLDITMPNLDGLSTLDEMVKIHQDARILVISALADRHTAINAIKRGADLFICKPFTDEELKAALTELFESHAP
ncbi:MAG: response regulator [Verrucomicrobiota bacterium]